MAFVDDDEEEEFVPQSASNYYFEDDEKIPVSFTRLPIQWSDKEKVVDTSATGLYLRGTSNEHLPLHKLVKAWRFDLTNFRPEISLLTKENIWITLEKPRKSFQDLIRPVLITVQSLQYLRRHPQASDKSLWEHLSRIFKSYDLKPSQNDLVDHIDLIAEAVKRDDKLAKSEFILAFLAKKPTKQMLPDEDDPKDDFIVEDESTVASDDDDLDDEDDDFFESVCAMCDNGGNLVCCEGSCLRSFHPTRRDGEDSSCDSLCLTRMQVEDPQKYYCPNCKHKIHSCFICKKLGSSDNTTGEAEVFQCVSATCGYFYHPHCVTRRLRRLADTADAEAVERQIIAGEFTCPLHKCTECGKGEDKTDTNLQFAVCRRCPTSYHRKCLPREIAFEDERNEDIVTRAWDGLLNNGVLIYCEEHEIDEDLGTPIRDHVKFPFTEEKKIFLKDKRKMVESHLGRDRKRPTMVKNLASRDTFGKPIAKSCRNPFPSSKDGVSTKNQRLFSSVPDNLRKRKEVDPSRKSYVGPNKFQRMMEYEESREAGKKKMEVNEPREVGKHKLGVKEAQRADKSKLSLGERLFNHSQERFNTVKPDRVVSVDIKHKKTDSVASKVPKNDRYTLDNDSQRRLLAERKKATEAITMDTILKKYKLPSTHTRSTMNNVNKTITMGKVEGAVQAVRTAVKKLEEGGTIEDAKAVCAPEVVSQIIKWKDKLKVYLAPFVHGARYTSFGRHFTNNDKLQQIVEKLHWYAEDGDMIVDFCCGSNDFSLLMNSKLEETGKKCLYKNYDIIQAKNPFNFEKRDWMTVRKEELLPGERLIMGINPPFGFKASLANQFIAKALEFRPKILILIVPRETQRVDKKNSSYVLIWEKKEFLSGKSFYMPGSVDVEEKRLEDWNVVSPPLSLWSRSDFAAKHKEISEKHCHSSVDMRAPKLKRIEDEANASLHPLGASDDISMLRDSPFENGENSRLENEDVPMDLDDDDFGVDHCVNNILVSEKIQAGETIRSSKEDIYTDRPSPANTGQTEEIRNKLTSYVRSPREDISTARSSPAKTSQKPEEMRSKLTSSCTSPREDISSLRPSSTNSEEVQNKLTSSVKSPREDISTLCPSPTNVEEMHNKPISSVRSSKKDISPVRSSSASTGERLEGKRDGSTSSDRSPRKHISTVHPSPAKTVQKLERKRNRQTSSDISPRNDISTVTGQKTEEMRNRPTSSDRSSREEISPANTGQKSEGVHNKPSSCVGSSRDDMNTVSSTSLANTVQNYEAMQNRSMSSLRSLREDMSVRTTPPSTSHRPYESPFDANLSHFDNGLVAKYVYGGGYRAQNAPLVDPYPLASSMMRNGHDERFDYRGGYSHLHRDYPQQQYHGHFDHPPPLHLMESAYPVQQPSAPHFHEVNYPRMSSLASHEPPMHPSGYNNYNSSGFPMQQPPPRDFGIGYAPAPNYHPYM